MATHIHHVFLYSSFLLLQFIFALEDLETYIVHMDKSSMPKAFVTHHSWYLATLQSATEKSTNRRGALDSGYSKLVYSYDNVIHGFSAVLSLSELQVLQSTPGYVSSMRDLPVKPDTTRTAQFLGLNAENGIWPASSYGKDVIIGVIDTGIWPESKSFIDDNMSPIPSRWKGRCQVGTQFNTSMCNKKLIGAKSFNRGLHAKAPNATFSMNSTRDTDGHGTHTSSTAAGSRVLGASYLGYAPGTSQGIAPMARVAMYKALWEIGAYSSDIIAAIDEAISDGVDVLSMSLGLNGRPLYQDPIAIATFAAVEKGIFVSTSAGNDGPFLASLHNGTPWVLTVAAGTVDRQFHGNVVLGNGVSVAGQTLYPGTNSSSDPISIVFLKFCDNLEMLQKVGYKIVVCQDVSDDITDQINLVKSSKVAAGVFITSLTDLEQYMMSSFPATFVNLRDGETIKNYINKSSKSAKAVIQFQKTTLGTKPAPQVTEYSSRGPSISCPSVLKPDLMAPGAQILASWPDNISVTDVNSQPVYSKFNVISGTSMSCPHAAGVGALLVASHPDWSPAAIRSSMMTTSDIVDNTGSPISDIGENGKPASPFAMGSGQINPNKALDPGLIYDLRTDDYINLLCKLNFTFQQIQTITRTSSYNCSDMSKSKSAFHLNYPSFIAYYNGTGTRPGPFQEFIRTVTNVGNPRTTYSAKITPIDGFEVSVVPDKLTFVAKNEKREFKLMIRGPVKDVEFLNFGYLTWVEDSGQHSVRSPIVITSIRIDDLANAKN
ncbi:unnamed protein product [Rhodiola kirilowii]